jgi:probable HAF family extracellular repeat protein
MKTLFPFQLRATTAALLCLLGATAAAASSPSIQYRVSTLPTAPGAATSSYVTGLNVQQQAVGWFSADGKVQGFLTQGDQAQALGDLGGGWVEGIALNDTGVVVGTARTARQVSHAFKWENGVLVDLDSQRRFDSSGATAINALGQVAGWATYSGVIGMRASLFGANGPVSLGSLDPDPNNSTWSIASDINAAGQVVGQSQVGGGGGQPRAFLYEGGQMRDLGTVAGMLGSWASAINERGWVTGTLDMGGRGLQAFLYDGNTLTGLGTLSGAIGTAQAFDINQQGDIVGGGFLAGRGVGFIHRGGQMLDLNTLVEPQVDSYIATANAINDNGVIAAQACGIGRPGCWSVLLTPVSAVPEPTTAALWLTSLLALGGLQRRRTGSRQG